MTASPCTWCVSDEPCPCPVFLRWDAEANPFPVEKKCLTCYDTAHLLLGGEAWEQVAARLHMRPGSLQTHVRRHGRDDLIPKAVAR